MYKNWSLMGYFGRSLVISPFFYMPRRLDKHRLTLVGSWYSWWQPGNDDPIV